MTLKQFRCLVCPAIWYPSSNIRFLY